ncbi:MAG: hypothetical protein AB9888_11780 [Bacteroidales bacterium]
MTIDEKFLKIEKKYAWSFFGVLLALIFGFITIYSVFFIDKSPRIDYIIETSNKVLALNADVKKLDIFYNGENIKEEHKNLTIITLKVVNSSSTNILNSYYDGRNPLGLVIQKAEIVENPELIAASNDYLKDNISLKYDTLSKVIFSNVIIEGNDYFIIKFLLLTKDNQKFVIQPIGKVAGVKQIRVIDNTEKNDQPTFWRRLIDGNIWIHLVRMVGYILLFIIIVVIIFVPTISLTEFIGKNRKKKKISIYKSVKSIENNAITDLVFETYLDNSIEYLEELQRLLSNERRLKGAYFNAERLSKRKEKIDDEHKPEILYSTDVSENIFIKSRNMLVPLIKLNLINYDKGSVIVNSDLIKELNDFISYIKFK